MYVNLSGDQIPVGGETSSTRRNMAWAHPASNTMGTESFQGYSGRSVALTTYCRIAPRLKKEQSCTLLPPCVFVAGSRVNCSFTLLNSFQKVTGFWYLGTKATNKRFRPRS